MDVTILYGVQARKSTVTTNAHNAEKTELQEVKQRRCTKTLVRLKGNDKRGDEMDATIKYKSLHRFKGILYDWHDDPYCGEHYQMTITDNEGKEVFHSYNATPKTVEELRDAVLAVQKEIEIARHEEKERQKGWKQQELIRSQQEAKQRKDSFKALKKEIGKYVIRYKSGERWKILFKNGEPLQFDTVAEAKAHIEKLKLSHPGIEFKQKKWLFKRY